MKSILHIAQILLLLSFFTYTSSAQDITDLYPFASYSLINTAEDSLGFQEPVELMHAPFAGPLGVYSNGLSVGSNPDASFIHTPFMSALYDSVFAISLDFNLENVDGTRRAILIVGGGYRYLGFEIQNDNTFQLLFNNTNLIPVAGVVPHAGTWYNLKIFHHQLNGVNEFYLDDTLVASYVSEFIRPNDDGEILNYNPGSGSAFQGFWRNLKIYGSSKVTAVQDAQPQQKSISLYPNPSNSMIKVNCPEINAVHWSISDLCGVNLLGGNMMDMQDELDIQVLTPGVYILHMYDADGWPLAHKKFVKN